jgi:hypothetical protein
MAKKSISKTKSTNTDITIGLAATVGETPVTTSGYMSLTDEPIVLDGKATFAPKVFDPNQIVTVKNGFQGRLVYKSKKTGERFVWDEFASEQDMELSELKSARSSAKKYFINNWFAFDDPEIIEYLGMTKYYKFALGIDEFDNLFEKSESEIRSTLSKLSVGQKKSIAYRAKQLIASGEIDSNRTIMTLEDCLGVELIERQ